MLGNGRLEAQCFDGVKRLANIRGKLRKKQWINQGDIVGPPPSRSRPRRGQNQALTPGALQILLSRTLDNIHSPLASRQQASALTRSPQ
jgi:hypothetical protein